MNLNTIHNMKSNVTIGFRLNSCLTIFIYSNQIFSLVKKTDQYHESIRK